MKNYHLYPTPEGTGAYPGAKPIKTDKSGSLIVPLIRIWQSTLIAYMVEPEFKWGSILYDRSGNKYKFVEYKDNEQTFCSLYKLGYGKDDPIVAIDKTNLTYYPPGHKIPESECVFVEEVDITGKKVDTSKYKTPKIKSIHKWQPVEEPDIEDFPRYKYPDPELKDHFLYNEKELEKAISVFRSKCLSGEIRIKEIEK